MSYLARRAAPAAESWTRAERILLLVLGGVIFLDALDGSLTQVALPSIGSSLHLGAARLQWIVSAYVLGYGGFLLLGGRSADLFGRRRVLVGGLAMLIAASAAGSLVGNANLLIAARFLKGASAGFTAPAALSILTSSFAEGHHRNRALGVYTAAAAAGFSFGLVTGGVLTELSWRLTFAVVVPAGLVLLVAVLVVIAVDQTAPGGRGRLDLGGASLITLAALLFVWGVVRAPTAGLLSAQTLGVIALAALLAGAFVIVETRVSAPLVRLSLMRSPRLLGANCAAMLVFGCATVFNVSTMLYEQDVLGWSPLQAGVLFLVASICTATVGLRAGVWATRIGATRVLLAGAVASLASYLLWMLDGVAASYPLIVTCLALQGAGFALAYPALNIQGLTGVATHEQGLVSGLIGSFFQIGGAVLLAIATALSLASAPIGSRGAAYVRGLDARMWVAVCGGVLLAVIAIGGLRSDSAEG